MSVVYRKKKKHSPYSHLNILLVIILCIGIVLSSSFLIMQYNDNKHFSMVDKEFLKQIDISLKNSSNNLFTVINNTKTPTDTAAKVNANAVLKEDFGFKLPNNAGKVVAKTSKKVAMSYFDDAVFIGDSVSEGFKVYKVLPSKSVIANQSVGLNQIAADKPVYSTAKGEITLNEALKNKKPKKLYILLGTNGIPGFSNKDQIKYYNQVVDELLKKYPKSLFYIQSVTPVTYARDKKETVVTNKKINEFNQMIFNMVIEKQKKFKNIYYLNVASSLKTKAGNLDTKVAGTDGLHFSGAGHKRMLEYYRTHAIAMK